MSYAISLTATVEKQLSKLNKELNRRFFNKIEKLSDAPEAGKPLRSPLNGYWELYFEKSFRVLYTVDNKSKIVTIMAIRHKDEF